MGDQVKIADIHTIERFRASLIMAAETFGLALEEAEGDIDRVVSWVENEQPEFWRRKIRKAQDAVVAAKSALYRKQEIKASADAKPSVVDEKKALDRAIKQLEYAEMKLRHTKKWGTELPRQTVLYKGSLSPMHAMLGREIPKINSMLKHMTEHLESYLKGGDDSNRLLAMLSVEAEVGNMSRGGEEDSPTDGDGASKQAPETGAGESKPNPSEAP